MLVLKAMISYLEHIKSFERISTSPLCKTDIIYDWCLEYI